MDLEPTDEQAHLVSAVREFLAREMPPSDLRDGRFADGFEERWRAAAGLGWFALPIPESAGGLGGTLIDEALLFIEIGRGVAPGPYLSTALACRLALTCGASPALLQALLDGESRVGLALPVEADPPESNLQNSRFLIVDGSGAGSRHLLVHGSGHLELIVAPPAAQLIPVASMDEGTVLMEASLDCTDAVLVAGIQDAEQIDLRMTILSAAMLAGIAEATRDMSVAYAKVRHQFKRPIGSFQAVSRRCADMATRAWGATSLVLLAALCTDAGRQDRDFQAAAARTVAGQAAARNTAENIQNLGAIGFTAEHDAHLYFKRARMIDTVWGDSSHTERLLVDGRADSGELGGGRQ